MDDQDKLSAMFAVIEEQQAAVPAAIATVIDSIKGTSWTLLQATRDAAARAVTESIGQPSTELLKTRGFMLRGS